MYRFTVHGFQTSPKEPCLWKLAAFTFGHMDLQTCQSWMDQLNYTLIKDVERPRNLLVISLSFLLFLVAPISYACDLFRYSSIQKVAKQVALRYGKRSPRFSFALKLILRSVFNHIITSRMII